jgi:hypothetical protein
MPGNLRQGLDKGLQENEYQKALANRQVENQGLHLLKAKTILNLQFY